MSSENAWRLDALDARGGLAFATWRDQENGFASKQASQTRSIFIGAPGFQPEIVANRSIAFSSTRGLFQSGLYYEEEEVTFPTAAAVAEFVRRAYLSGGGSDGSDDGGSDVPPLLDDPDGRLEVLEPLFEAWEEDHGLSLKSAVKDALIRIAELLDNTPPGGACNISKWPKSADLQDTHLSKSKFTDGLDILSRAAASLILEMLHRLPLNGASEALLRWNYSATHLGAILARFGLVEPLMTGRLGYLFDQYCYQIVQQGQRIPLLASLTRFGSSKQNYRFAIPVIFCRNGILENNNLLLEHHLDYPYSGAAELYTPFHLSGDSAIALECLPVPRDVAQHCESADRDGDPSVMNLLSFFLGSPVLALENERCFDIALLAATVIASNRTTIPSFDLWNFRSSHVDPDIRHHWFQNQADTGWDWLRVQLPTQVFSEPVEDLIRSVAGMRYRPNKPESDRDFQ